MKIWIINHYAIPPSEVGGTRHFTLARELTRKGHDVTIIASSFDHFAQKEVALSEQEQSKRETIDSVPFVWLRTPPYRGNSKGRIWNMLVFAARVWMRSGLRHLDPPDVIIGSSPHLFAALAAEQLARQFKVPFVLEVRDLWPETLVEMTRLTNHHPVVRGLEVIERYVYRRASRIVSLLPGAGIHMVEKGADPEKIMWLPNGIDLNLIPDPHPPESKGTFTVLYAGAHGLANGLRSILEAAALLQEEGWGDRIHLRFVGQGPEKQNLQDMATRLGLKNVHFEAPVPKSQIGGLLKEADAFIVTMRNVELYKFGISFNKIYDYLAAARPVVFGSNSLNNPIADADAGLTVAPEDPRAMADAIKQLAEMSPTERWEMGQRGRRFVEEHHDFEQLTVRLENFLKEVVPGDTPASASARQSSLEVF